MDKTKVFGHSNNMFLLGIYKKINKNIEVIGNWFSLNAFSILSLQKLLLCWNMAVGIWSHSDIRSPVCSGTDSLTVSNPIHPIGVQ